MNLRDAYYSLVTKDNYLDYQIGETNLLLTAPHGGGIKPINIPRRKTGVLVQDTYTRRLTYELASLFTKKPYLLVANIHRSRVDLNRNLVQCCEGNWRAEEIWKDWQYKMANTIVFLNGGYKKSLYIDIHSHNDGDYFELGYNISANNYIRLYNNRYARLSSTLNSLDGNLYEMLFGNYSIKRSLESCGYKTLFPTGKEVYFNGGRNVEQFSGNGVGAVQIEVPVSILKTDLQHVAMCLYNSISIFKERFVDNVTQ